MLLLASTLNYSKLILLTLQIYFSLIFQLSLLLWWSTQVSYFHFHFHFVDLLELHIFSFTFFAWASYFQVRGPQPQPVDLFAWPRIHPTEEACGVEAYQQQDFQGWLVLGCVLVGCWFLVGSWLENLSSWGSRRVRCLQCWENFREQMFDIT